MQSGGKKSCRFRPSLSEAMFIHLQCMTDLNCSSVAMAAIVAGSQWSQLSRVKKSASGELPVFRHLHPLPPCNPATLYPSSLTRCTSHSLSLHACRSFSGGRSLSLLYEYHCLSLEIFSFSRLTAIFTSSTTWKSNMPTQQKSAPFSKAYRKPSFGWIAPAPNTL